MTLDVRALAFDVFGTVVDWRTSVARELGSVLAPKGHRLDWEGFADQWRSRYQPAMERVRNGERPFVILDVLHRENLVELLKEYRIEDLSEAEIDHLNQAWHRLDAWPDVLEGLRRLKHRFVLAALSNGNVALLVHMAKRAGLPWDVILGAEVTRAYKPTPEAYDRAATMLAMEPSRCLMVAAHPADLVAAAARGFRTAYVHRPLEYGRDHADRARPAQTFDLAVDTLTELADKLIPRPPEGCPPDGTTR
jgi:2-haloacid dehalogenase